MSLTCCLRSTHPRHRGPVGGASMRLLLVLSVLLLLARYANAAPSSHLRGASTEPIARDFGDDASSSSVVDPEEDRRIVNGAASYLLAPKVVIAPVPSAHQHPQDERDGEFDEEADPLLEALSKEEQQTWDELWEDDFLGEDHHDEEDGEVVNMIGSHLPEGVDLNDYNLTWHDDETGEELTHEDMMKHEKHRRKLIAVTSNEYNNAKFVQYERISRGLGGLGWSYDLIVQAQKWARYMAATGDFQHRSKLSTGIASGWKLLEENIAMNTRVTRDGAFTALMNSPGHRANILNNQITKIGIGISRGGDGYYYMCQIFKATWN